MRTLFLLALLPALAFAGSPVPDAQQSYVASIGAHAPPIHDFALAQAYKPAGVVSSAIEGNGLTNTGGTLAMAAAGAASAGAVTTGAQTIAGAKTFSSGVISSSSFQSNTGQFFSGTSGSPSINLRGNTADSGTNIGTVITQLTTLTGLRETFGVSPSSTASARTFWLNPSGKINLDATDGSGTPGAATINKPAFKVAVALGASSVVVTNSTVLAASVVQCNLQTNDATALYVRSAIPSAGSVTVHLSANTTAATTVGCVVFN